MARQAQIRARTDAETKEQAEAILSELGMSPSTAINIFYRQIVMRRGLPFPAEIPNAETRAAFDEARTGRARDFDIIGEIASIAAKQLHMRPETVRRRLAGS